MIDERQTARATGVPTGHAKMYFATHSLIDELLEAHDMLLMCRPRPDQFHSAETFEVAMKSWSQDKARSEERIAACRHQDRLAPRE